MGSITRSLLTATSLAATTFAHAAPPPVDAFFDSKESSSLELSPSGDFLAVIDRDAEPDVVHILDAGTLANVKSLSLGVDDLMAVKWVTDDRLLVRAFVPVDYRIGNTVHLDAVPTRQLISLQRDGSGALTLLNDARFKAALNRSQIVSLLPEDPDHILMAVMQDRRIRLLKVAVATGETEEIERGSAKTFGWQVTREGEPVVRMERTSRGRYLKIQTRAPGSDKWKTLAKVKAEDFESVSPIAPTDDSGIWYIAGRGPGEDVSAIWLYDLREGTYLEKVFGMDGIDVDEPVLDAQGKFVGAAFDGKRREFEFKDATIAAHLKGLRNFLGTDNEVRFESISRSGNRWLLHVDGPQQPGVHYVYDIASRKADYINSVNPSLAPEQLGRVEIIDYTARDGNSLWGYLTHPVGRTIRSAPLVVLPHGGPQERDHYGFSIMPQFLASRGYAVFQPNFRGGTGFGTAFTEASHGEWGGVMQDDVTDGVRHLIDTGIAPQDRIAIAGWSYGGYAALMGPVRDPGLYQCAVAINGVADLDAMMDYDKAYFGRQSEAYEAMLAMIGHPKKDAAHIEARSPINHIENFDIPVLIIAGEDDKRVSPEQAQAMADALKAAGKDVRHVVYPGADHSLEGEIPGEAASNKDSDDAAADDADDKYAYKAALKELEAFLPRCFTG